MGGAYRAFVRLRTVGCQGVPDLAQVAAAYKEGKRTRSADFQRATAMATAVKQARLWGVRRKGSAFGSNSRDVRRSQLLDMQRVLLAKGQGLEPEARAASLSDDVLAVGLRLSDALAIARGAGRLELSRQRAADDALMEELVGYRSTEGAALIEELRQQAPGLEACELQAVPGPCPCVEVQPPDFEKITDAVAWAQANAKNLGASLEAAWKQAHRPVSAKASANDGAPHADEVTSPCLIAGMCICSGGGRKTAQIAATLLANMKRMFPVNSRGRKLLLEGFIVLKLTGEPNDDYEAALADEGGFVQTYLHVGLMYLKPFRPTFAKLRTAPDTGEAPFAAGRQYVQAGVRSTDGRMSLEGMLFVFFLHPDSYPEKAGFSGCLGPALIANNSPANTQLRGVTHPNVGHRSEPWTRRPPASAYPYTKLSRKSVAVAKCRRLGMSWKSARGRSAHLLSTSCRSSPCKAISRASSICSRGEVAQGNIRGRGDDGMAKGVTRLMVALKTVLQRVFLRLRRTRRGWN